VTIDASAWRSKHRRIIDRNDSWIKKNLLRRSRTQLAARRQIK
jgi:hypothetical protein